MNVSGISNKSLIGKILRFFLNLLPKQMQIPILQGRLKGKKWIVGASNHGCWIGSYENDKQLLFVKMIKNGSTVFDLGGNVGFYTLLASDLVGPQGEVYVFEPVPRNLLYLKKHIQLNQIKNVKVIEAAVSNITGLISFEAGIHYSTGHISSEGKLLVKSVSLDELFSNGEIPAPHFIKIDIEGAELLALIGAKLMLTKSHPTIFLATHDKNTHLECCQLLQSLEYKLQAIGKLSIEQTDEILAIYEFSSAGFQ